MREYVICPFSKPQHAQKLVDNIRRQERKGFRVIVVENGPAVGSFPKMEGTVVLRSEAHQSAAKNVGLGWIRREGGGRWSVFDCDDYYGPGYLEDHMCSLNAGHDVVGKAFGSIMYVLFDDGLYLDGTRQTGPGKFVNGGAMSCRTAEVPDFPTVDVGEDGEWHKMVTKSGFKTANTGARHYCYNRVGTDHTWRLEARTESMLKKRMLFLGDLPEKTCELPPRVLASESGQHVSRVVMLHTPDYLPASVAVPDMERYCRLWGYELESHGDLLKPDWPASWNKVPALLEAMSRTPEGEWVLWMDCDMLMTRLESPLEVMTRADKDMMFSVDGNGICLGYFMVRNVPAMRDFLESLVQDWRPDWPWDQDSAKAAIARSHEIAARVGHIPESVVQNPASRPSRHSMVVHYWGNSRDRERLTQRMMADVAERDRSGQKSLRPWMRTA